MVTKRPHPTHWAATLRALRGLRSVRGWPTRVRVEGDSMLPALAAGDRLLVVPWSPLRAGHVVAVHDPRQPARVLVKRVHAFTTDGPGVTGPLDVRGDNTGASTDSRHFGPVPLTSVVGRAVYRYHPPDRAGWLRGDGGG